MELLSDEQILLTSNDNSTILTTHRVRYQTKIGGKTSFSSIMLEMLSSCEFTQKTNPALLWLSVVFLLIGISLGFMVDENSYYVLGGIILAIIFFIAYYLYRRGMILLSCAGANIYLPVSRMSVEKMIEFVNAIESAKNKRYLLQKNK